MNQVDSDMEELSYTDYYYSDKYVRFTGDSVEELLPHEKLLGEAQLNYQRIELRWDGCDEIQEFSVTKDGLCILCSSHKVNEMHEEWARTRLAELKENFIDELPSYAVCWRECNGPNLEGEVLEDYCTWDGHELFYFELANDAVELNYADPDRFYISEWSEDLIYDMYNCYEGVWIDEDGCLDVRVSSYSTYDEPATVLDEQPRSRFVDNMQAYLTTLRGMMSDADVTISEEKLAELSSSQRESKIEAKRKAEMGFVDKALIRLAILFCLAPIFWIYVRSAALSLGYEEPNYALSFLFGTGIWAAWHSVLIGLSFKKGGDGWKNLRIIRRRLKRG